MKISQPHSRVHDAEDRNGRASGRSQPTALLSRIRQCTERGSAAQHQNPSRGPSELPRRNWANPMPLFSASGQPLSASILPFWHLDGAETRLRRRRRGRCISSDVCIDRGNALHVYLFLRAAISRPLSLHVPCRLLLPGSALFFDIFVIVHAAKMRMKSHVQCESPSTWCLYEVQSLQITKSEHNENCGLSCANERRIYLYTLVQHSPPLCITADCLL